MQVTPGITLAEGELITTEKLNLLGQPVVALDDEDFDNIREQLETELGNGIAGRNYFVGSPGTELEFAL